MEQDYNLKKWSKGCPNTGINCRRSSCGIEYVFIPAALGDDQEGSPVAPKNGSYNNAIVYYEATGNVYLYSSDGVPTRVGSNSDAIIAELQKELNDVEEDLSEEATVRETADAALGGRIDTVADNLATETANRIGADEDLQTDITAEATARQNADTALQNNINAEISARTNADTALQNNITAEATARANADTALGNRLTTVEGIAGTALQPQSIDKVVMTDISLSANTSTTTVQIDGAKENILTGATSTKNVPLPVASTTQAGVMNSSTYDAVTSNTNNINAIMNGAVAITGISANPSQSDLTTAWQTETGLTALINRASIYDVTNNKVWTYYTNDTTWHAASNSSQVTISTFTNNSEGTIKGSTNVGQIFAENDGTGSVNGWDNLSNAVSTNTSDIADLQAAMPTVNDATLTIQNNGTNVATFTANSATNTTANIVSPVDIGSVLSTPSDIAYVNSNNIISNAVTTGKIANGAVTANKIDFATSTDANGWAEMDCGSFKIYLKNGVTTVTVGGNSWRSDVFSSKPVNLNLNNVFSGICCGMADDNAVSLNGRIGNGNVYFTLVNHYAQSITAPTRWNAIIIEFIAS